MIPSTIPVNAYLVSCRPFQQLLFAVFRGSYSKAAVDRLCIKQALYVLLLAGYGAIGNQLQDHATISGEPLMLAIRHREDGA